jgi:hypothetical protein
MNLPSTIFHILLATIAAGGLVIVLLVGQAGAQLAPQEKQLAIASLTSEINRAIQRRQTTPNLREKVVRRICECMFMYRVLGKWTGS